ncbi:MAG: DUF1893 domain-containing protein [Clostridia bacterium]|nr:DUF1893 domain-containing protein [Clostridia bacterium]
MTDIEIAKSNLAGHTISLCKNGKTITDDKRGIAPMADFLRRNVDLRGYSVADLVVGKAAAMLFSKAGIAEVYAKTLSLSGKAALEKHGIKYSYGVLTERIVNRQGTDVCPMEKTVETVDDVEEAYVLLQERLAELRTAVKI